MCLYTSHPFLHLLFLSLETTCRYRHCAADHWSYGGHMVRHLLHSIRQEDGDSFPAKDHMQAMLCCIWQCERVGRGRSEGRRGWYGVSTGVIVGYHHTPYRAPHRTEHTQGGISSCSTALCYCIALYSSALHNSTVQYSTVQYSTALHHTWNRLILPMRKSYGSRRVITYPAK